MDPEMEKILVIIVLLAYPGHYITLFYDRKPW